MNPLKIAAKTLLTAIDDMPLNAIRLQMEEQKAATLRQEAASSSKGSKKADAKA